MRLGRWRSEHMQSRPIWHEYCEKSTFGMRLNADEEAKPAQSSAYLRPGNYTVEVT
jgi:hypothetical protein